MAERPPLEIVEETGVRPALDRAIRALLCECFPVDAEAFSRQRWWHGSMPAYSVISRQGDRLVGHVAIVDRRIACDGEPLRVAGVQSLAVAPAWRGTGLSRQLMREAIAEARRRGIPFGLLFCVPGLEPFYRGLGWQKSDQPVTMADEQGRAVPLPTKNIVMQLPLAEHPFPPGRIDLRGRDW